MALLHATGFEVNNSLGGYEATARANTPVHQATTVWSGKYSMQGDTTGGAATSNYTYTFAAGDSSQILHYQFRFRVDQFPSASCIIGLIRNAANANMGIFRMTTTGTLFLQTAGGATIGSASQILNLNQWYLCEVKHDATTSPGACEFKLSDEAGNLLFTTSGANSVQGSWNKLILGASITSTANFYFDDLIAWDDTAGGVFTTWLGNVGMVHSRPQSQGDANAWLDTAAAAGTVNNRQLVYETNPDDATTMVQSVTLNNEDMYHIQDSGLPENATVHAVLVGGRHRDATADATTAFKYQWRIAPAGTTTQSAAIIPNTTNWRTHLGANSTNVLPYPIIAYTNPSGGAITVAQINASQIGMILSAAGVNRAQVTVVWMIAIYALPAFSRTAATTRQLSTSNTGPVG